MAKATVEQAARDERDVFEQGSEAAFSALIPTVAAGKEPGERSFSDWWAKDSTQEKFHGIMGSLGATFTGLAGIPLGGGDMSSMERAGVRAAAAPGQARQMIREKQFHRYIDTEMANTKDPRRKDMLMAVRTNPQAAAQYLAMESPGSKKERDESLATLKHGYKMAEIGFENEARGAGNPLTGNRLDDIGTANEMFKALTQEERDGMRERGYIPFKWIDMGPAALSLIPHLYSPGRGILAGGGGDFPFDLKQTRTVTDPETGQKTTMGLGEWFASLVNINWDDLNPFERSFWDFVLKRDELEGTGSPEEKAARKEAGLK